MLKAAQLKRLEEKVKQRESVNCKWLQTEKMRRKAVLGPKQSQSAVSLVSDFAPVL